MQSIETSALTNTHWVMMTKGKHDPDVTSGTTRWCPKLEFSPVDESLVFGVEEIQTAAGETNIPAAVDASETKERYVSPLLTEALANMSAEQKTMQDGEIDNEVNEWASAVTKYLDPLLPELRGDRAEAMFTNSAPALVLSTKLKLIGDILTSVMIEGMLADKLKPPEVRRRLVDYNCILISDSINKFKKTNKTYTDNRVTLTWDISGLRKGEWDKYNTAVNEDKAPWMKFSATAGATVMSMCLDLEEMMKDLPDVEEQNRSSTTAKRNPVYVLIQLTCNEFCDQNWKLVRVPMWEEWLGALHRMIDLVQKKANRSIICIGGDAKMWELGPNFDTWRTSIVRCVLSGTSPTQME